MKKLIALIALIGLTAAPALAQHRFDLTVATPVQGKPAVNTTSAGLSYELTRFGNVRINAVALARNFNSKAVDFTGGIGATLPLGGTFSVGVAEVLHQANAVQFNHLDNTKLDTLVTLGIRL